MLEQKFRIGEKVTTPLAQKEGNNTIWIVDAVKLRYELGIEPYLVYSIRKLNSYDDDFNGICCFYFTENELISLEDKL